jgi:hypothetical protein
MIKAVLTPIFEWMPVIFGVGFLAPVIAAFLNAGGVAAPLGFAPIQVGLAVGLTWGLIAKFTGRWI